MSQWAGVVICTKPRSLDPKGASNGELSGRVIVASRPVVGASVTLYAAGTPESLAQTTTDGFVDLETGTLGEMLLDPLNSTQTTSSRRA